jgi:hypothetical protein
VDTPFQQILLIYKKGWGRGGEWPHFSSRRVFPGGPKRAIFNFGVKPERGVIVSENLPSPVLMSHLLFVELVPLQVKREPTPSPFPHPPPRHHLPTSPPHPRHFRKKSLSENNYFFGVFLGTPWAPWGVAGGGTPVVLVSFCPIVVFWVV